jgi:hypothetical protein
VKTSARKHNECPEHSEANAERSEGPAFRHNNCLVFSGMVRTSCPPNQRSAMILTKLRTGTRNDIAPGSKWLLKFETFRLPPPYLPQGCGYEGSPDISPRSSLDGSGTPRFVRRPLALNWTLDGTASTHPGERSRCPPFALAKSAALIPGSAAFPVQCGTALLLQEATTACSTPTIND